MSRLELTPCRGARIAPLCALAIALLVPAYASATDAPPRLVDGSTPPALPQALRAHGNKLRMTRVTVGTLTSMRALLSGCPQAREARGGKRVVERVGYSGRSVTFLVNPTVIAGCDRNPRARATYGPWCGVSGWNFTDGRVSDPRLDVCYDRRNRPIIAFGWINPVRHTKWIVVDQSGYREVYPVAGGLPVRVSTVTGLRMGSALFHTAQYDAHGVLLVRRKVVAAIAS